MAISAVVITLDSERCLDAVLSSLQGFDEILVCDMESTDNTLDIARRYGARIISYPRGKHTHTGVARNFAIRHAHHEWVLAVEPDEIVPPALRNHLYRIIKSHSRSGTAPDGIRIPRMNHILHRFNSATYPDYQLRFFRREVADWQPGKDVQPQVDGPVDKVAAHRRPMALIHVGRDLAHFIKVLNSESSRHDESNDSVRISISRIMWRCNAIFWTYYLGEGGCRYGLPGFLRACNKAMEEYFTLSKIYEKRVMDAFFESLPVSKANRTADENMTASDTSMQDAIAPADRTRRMADRAKSIATFLITGLMTLVISCGASGNSAAQDSIAASANDVTPAAFDADSAYSYVARQVDFGPRVPNTEAHRKTGEWLASELERHGALVQSQRPTLRAFDGTMLKARNIFAQYNPEAERRILLMAHYDSRPWADHDPDPDMRAEPVEGANDGASGVGVLLELARQFGADSPAVGVDILLSDAEDWGSEGDDESWAMGTRYFAQNPPVEGYAPMGAVLLDMVGAPDAVFPHEYFSMQAAPAMVTDLWNLADALGYGSRFVNTAGGAINDDHLQLIEAGIPTVDIIDLRQGGGFMPRWHTTSDTLEGISRETLGEVGTLVATYVRSL